MKKSSRRARGTRPPPVSSWRVPPPRYALPRDHAALREVAALVPPGLLAVGPFLTSMKELFRLVTVKKTFGGTLHLFRGILDGREITANAGWMTMPPLEPGTEERA